MDVCVLTGADSDGGVSLARLLVERGFRVYGLVEEQRNWGFEHSDFIPLEYKGEDRQQVEAIMRAVLEHEKGIFSVVHLARSFSAQSFRDLDTDRIESLVFRNLTLPLIVNKILLPGVIQEHGHLVQCCCPVGKGPRVGGTLYLALEDGLQRFYRRLYEEVRPHGVRVSCLRPFGVLGAAAQDQEPGQVITGEFLAASIMQVLTHGEGSFYADLEIRPEPPVKVGDKVRPVQPINLSAMRLPPPLDKETNKKSFILPARKSMAPKKKLEWADRPIDYGPAPEVDDDEEDWLEDEELREEGKASETREETQGERLDSRERRERRGEGRRDRQPDRQQRDRQSSDRRGERQERSDRAPREDRQDRTEDSRNREENQNREPRPQHSPQQGQPQQPRPEGQRAQTQEGAAGEESGERKRRRRRRRRGKGRGEREGIQGEQAQPESSTQSAHEGEPARAEREDSLGSRTDLPKSREAAVQPETPAREPAPRPTESKPVNRGEHPAEPKQREPQVREPRVESVSGQQSLTPSALPSQPKKQRRNVGRKRVGPAPVEPRPAVIQAPTISPAPVAERANRPEKKPEVSVQTAKVPDSAKEPAAKPVVSEAGKPKAELPQTPKPTESKKEPAVKEVAQPVTDKKPATKSAAKKTTARKTTTKKVAAKKTTTKKVARKTATKSAEKKEKSETPESPAE